MLFIDTNALEVIQICVTSFIGMFGVSAGLEGWLLHHMKWYERVMAAVGGLMLIYPGLTTDLAGLGLVGIVLVFQLLGRKKALAK